MIFFIVSFISFFSFYPFYFVDRYCREIVSRTKDCDPSWVSGISRHVDSLVSLV